VGLAGGILAGTLSFEMLPKALEQASLPGTLLGFAVGFGLVYLLDLWVNRGMLAGANADQKQKLKHRKPRGTQVTVLAGATRAEELIEGSTIGVGAAIDPSVAVVVGMAICIGNISEALSIGALAREEGKHWKRRTILWTSLMGVSLFASSMAGWFSCAAFRAGSWVSFWQSAQAQCFT